MVLPEHGEQRPSVPEVLAVLNIRDRNREPILTDEVVGRIRQVLGVSEAIVPVEKAHSINWNISSPSGISLDLSAHFTQLGRVISADILAYDEVGVTYKEDESQRNVRMTGISKILLFVDDNGKQALQFVQTTAKRLKKITIREEKVVLYDDSSGNKSLPQALIRNFKFIV